jgi:Tryptophan halogenase
MVKIVIVGGGSSGWISAATLIGVPNSDVTVIESPTVSTIGVGESTISGFVDWMNLVGIRPEDMMKDTDASYKLAIKFENFLGEGHECYYPFGKVIFDKDKYLTWARRRVISPEIGVPFADTFFANMSLIRSNKMKKDSDTFNHNNHALHFDATKFGVWLRENYCKPRNVKHIEKEVTNIEVGEEGIRWLELSDGTKVEADLFVDCTGFKSMLLEGALGVPFIDYSNVIPNNMAWATHMPYVDKEKELVGYTNCTAIENGWVWNIPLWSKIGTGYVYSNKFVTDEQALDEFKNHIRKSGRDPETLEYKKIQMRNGIHEKVWHKNVVAIGLAAGFIEPLESTGLWFTHEFAYALLRLMYRGAPISQYMQDIFNKNCSMQWDQTVNFVTLHYALSARRDTEYWREIGRTKYPLEHNFVFASYNTTERWYSNWPGINAITHGFEYHFIDDTYLWMYLYPKNNDWKKYFDPEFKMLELERIKWYDEIKDTPSLLEVLKTIHEK